MTIARPLFNECLAAKQSGVAPNHPENDILENKYAVHVMVVAYF